MGDGEFPITEGFTRGFPTLEGDALALGIGRRWARRPSNKSLSPENLRTRRTSPGDERSTIIRFTKGFFTLQKPSPQGSCEGHSCGAFKALLHLPKRDVQTQRGAGVLGNTSDRGKEATGYSQGLLFPPHPLCLLCSLAQAQLRGTSRTPLTVGDTC